MLNKGKNVLASVFNKGGVAKLAKTLHGASFGIIASEGTGIELSKNGISFTHAEKISKNPKGLEDCIKTISFRIEAGILFDRKNPTQVKEANKLGIVPIDMVICNFPPIEEVVKKSTDFNVGNIDVGGPLMVRAAAVNFRNVLVIVDPNDYKKVGEAVGSNKITDKLRQQLAMKAFHYCSQYDSKIVEYLRSNDLSQ